MNWIKILLASKIKDEWDILLMVKANDYVGTKERVLKNVNMFSGSDTLWNWTVFRISWIGGAEICSIIPRETDFPLCCGIRPAPIKITLQTLFESLQHCSRLLTDADPDMSLWLILATFARVVYLMDGTALLRPYLTWPRQRQWLPWNRFLNGSEHQSQI